MAQRSPEAQSNASIVQVCIIEPGQKAVETPTKVPGVEELDDFQSHPPSACWFFFGGVVLAFITSYFLFGTELQCLDGAF